MTSSIKVTELRNEKGDLHCDDGPAVFDEKKEYVKYYKNGKLHRLDGPAVIQPIYVDGKNTVEEWYLNGLLHRDGDEPAVNNTSITKAGFEGYEKRYHKYGKLHRLNGPARILYDPHESEDCGLMYEWFKNDVFHRDNGPAQYIIYNDGDIACDSYYHHGYELDNIWVPVNCNSMYRRPLYLGPLINIPIYAWVGIKNMVSKYNPFY
jgi:hypothetical protein